MEQYIVRAMNKKLSSCFYQKLRWLIKSFSVCLLWVRVIPDTKWCQQSFWKVVFSNRVMLFFVWIYWHLFMGLPLVSLFYYLSLIGTNFKLFRLALPNDPFAGIWWDTPPIWTPFDRRKLLGRFQHTVGRNFNINYIRLRMKFETYLISYQKLTIFFRQRKDLVENCRYY